MLFFALAAALVGVAQGPPRLFVAAALNGALAWGLARGSRLAYILALVFALLGIGVALGRAQGAALAVLVGNGIVIVPMVISTRFFFPEAEVRESRTGDADA